ncbi:unnamed protein product, partial [Effrenium voratum]
FMVENLLDFLTPTCVGRCRNIISSFSKTRNTRLDQIVKLKRTMRDIPKNNKAQLASFKKKLNAHKDAIKVCGEALLVSLFNEMLRDGGFRANVDVIDGKQVALDELMSDAHENKLLVIMDWSSMGRQEGFCGNYGILAAVMLALTSRLKASLLIHECTRLFPYSVFEKILSGYRDYHQILECAQFGAPVKRSRSYDVVVRSDLILPNGMDRFAALKTSCVLDASVWLQAPQEKVAHFKRYMAALAMRGSVEEWEYLLPPAALANLRTVQEIVRKENFTREVAANLDQNPHFQPHYGDHMPVILASISHMRLGIVIKSLSLSMRWFSSFYRCWSSQVNQFYGSALVAMIIRALIWS